MAKRYAEIKDSMVTSVRLYDEGKQPDELTEVTEMTGPAGVGFSWDGSRFIAPPKPPKTEKQVRRHRNRLLLASDWTQTLDAPVDRAAWADYRQKLRNISAQEGFPGNVVWPEAP